MLDVRRLEVLQRFAVLGSITAVAHDLGYSASAISQQLATLEREAGISLIERTAQSATLTGAGRELAEHAVTVLAAVEAAASRMHELAGTVSGHVEVSCLPSLAGRLAPELAMEQLRHPALSIVARETESIDAAAAVLDGRSDLAIIADWSQQPGPPTSGLTAFVLRREPVLLGVPDDHPQARRSSPVSAAGLAEIIEGQTWLCAPTGHLSRTAGDARLAMFDATPGGRWEFQGLLVQAGLVAAGAGVAFLPASIVDEQPGVTGLALRPRMQRRLVALTRSSREKDPALRSCLEAARRAIPAG